MPLQNRVTPTGAIIATAARGTMMGNRGRLHNADKQIVRQARGTLWIICLLEFRGRGREVMHPRSYTELFFLDEAVALAAGHRPCGECRRTAYRSYLDAVNATGNAHAGGARELDRLLHASRTAPPATTAVANLPDGAFITLGDNDFRLLWRGALHRWTPAGYVDAISAAGVDHARVLTPAVSVDALRRGYAVDVHVTAR